MLRSTRADHCGRARCTRGARDRGARRWRRRGRRHRRPHASRSPGDRRRRAARRHRRHVRPSGRARTRARVGCRGARPRREGHHVTAAAVPPPRRATKRFGQHALATPANFVTLSRIVVAIPTLALIRSGGSSWLTVALWFAITASDSLDGWLARRDGATRSGAFLDPLADKTIVLGGLGALAARGDLLWLPVLLIAAREIGISIYRSVAGRRGIVLPAQRLGKYKAFTQYAAVGFVVLPISESWRGVQQLCLWLAVFLTVVSGLQIVRHGYVDWQRDK